MLRYRLLFGPLLLVLVFAVCWAEEQLDALRLEGTVWQTVFLGREYLPAGLLLLTILLAVIPLAARELTRIFRAKGIEADVWMLSFAGMLGCLMTYAIPSRTGSLSASALVATLTVAVFLTALVRHSWPRQRTEGAVAVAAATLFALVYLGLLPGFLVAIRRWHSPWVVLGVIFIAKSCDIGAFFTGMAVGRTKLIPWLSPRKTVEGLIGGVILSMLMALLLVELAQHWNVLGQWCNVEGQRVFEAYHCPWWFAVLAGGVLGLFGHFGDLVASLFKRDAGIKDSGHAIPGFGGVIDVIDSAIIVAPLAYWMLFLLQKVSP